MRFKGEAASDPGTCFPDGEQFLTCTHIQSTDKDGQPLKSKAKNDMWVLEFTVAEGPYKDRKLWHYLVWLQAGQAGHGMALKTIKAFGIDPEGDNEILPEHLLNVTVKAFVKIQDGKDGYEPKNVVGKWVTPADLQKAAPFSSGTAQAPEAVPAGATSAATQQPPLPATPKKKSLWGN